MTVDPRPEPNGCTNPSPDPANNPDKDTADNDTADKSYAPTPTRQRWARTWPSLLAAVTLTTVGGPAAVASYRHARDVITQHGDPVMAPWLALTTDGMLLAALTVIWVRRHRNQPVKTGPWAAFWAGMTATIAANLAAAQPTPIGIIVALWPPICLAITLELVALVAYPNKQHQTGNGTQPGERATHVPNPATMVPGRAPAAPALGDRAPDMPQAGRDTGADNLHQVTAMPAAPTTKTSVAPACWPAGINGHQRPESAVPVQGPPNLFSPPGSAPATAETGPPTDTDPGHRTGQNGHHEHTRTGHTPDAHILAWLRHQAHTTGHVPGRRQAIEKWALGSTRAERLRAIVIKESAAPGPTPASELTGGRTEKHSEDVAGCPDGHQHRR